MKIGLLLEMVAEGAGDRVVVGSQVGGLTAADLLRRSRSGRRRWFAASGAEHVGFVDVNSEALPIALFGAAIAGLPFAPVNYRLTDEQLDAILRRLAPGLVVVGPEVSGAHRCDRRLAGHRRATSCSRIARGRATRSNPTFP